MGIAGARTRVASVRVDVAIHCATKLTSFQAVSAHFINNASKKSGPQTFEIDVE